LAVISDFAFNGIELRGLFVVYSLNFGSQQRYGCTKPLEFRGHLTQFLIIINGGMGDPARSLDRAREYWRQHGRSEKWIQQRMMGQETRNKLTDYWKDHEIKGEDEYAVLTNYYLFEGGDCFRCLY
jgi:hypothetical protein